MSGYGIKVQTDTGRWIWLTDTGTTVQKAKALKFDSETGAEMYRENLSKNNPDAALKVEKL